MKGFKFVHRGHRPAEKPVSTECFGYGIAKKVNAFHRSFPGYEPTPLLNLKSFAGALGVKSFHVKDESKRFGLNAFKVLGGSYAIGGFTGATVSLAMARGASRGIFSNEAGMGTAATVHATARTDHPAHQGMYGILEVFVTIIVCTLTALIRIPVHFFKLYRVLRRIPHLRRIPFRQEGTVGFIVLLNMIALIALSPKFFKLFKEYKSQ